MCEDTVARAQITDDLKTRFEQDDGHVGQAIETVSDLNATLLEKADDIEKRSEEYVRSCVFFADNLRPCILLTLRLLSIQSTRVRKEAGGLRYRS